MQIPNYFYLGLPFLSIGGMLNKAQQSNHTINLPKRENNAAEQSHTRGVKHEVLQKMAKPLPQLQI